MIQVLSPGLQTTVQDLGREGHGLMGVSPSGAADPVSLRLGNRLVGNPEGAAALEFTLLGGAFQFFEPSIVALAGSDFDAKLDGVAVPPWSSFEVRAGQTLKMGHTQSGARCYLCVHGGILVEPFLGSASTHLLSGLGGFHGRALRKGDAIETGRRTLPFRKRTVSPLALQFVTPRKTLRATDGPQCDWFGKAAKTAFYGAIYRVSEEANRMGLRLQGEAIKLAASGHMVSEGAPLGAIQIPPGGQPIILFVEQQTAGGYPKMANVISADLASIGQLRPRDEIRFERVTLEAARAALREREDLLASKETILE